MIRSNSNNESDYSDTPSPVTHSSIRDFQVLNKLGKLELISSFIGTGAFSDVFRAKRLSDGIEYALKKVMYQYRSDYFSVLLMID